VANTLEHVSINNLAQAGKKAQEQLWKDFGSEAVQGESMATGTAGGVR
jgi:hypothetical protein